MIGTIACVALAATAYMIVTALAHRRTTSNDSALSTWSIARQIARESNIPWWAQFFALAADIPGLARYWAWRLLHPTVQMMLSAAIWVGLVVLGTASVEILKSIEDETGWPLPLLLALSGAAVTLWQLASTARRVGRGGALRIARFDIIPNLLIPLSTWAVAAVIGTLA